jgi:hypothetical protein
LKATYFEYLEKCEVFLHYLPPGVVSCKKTIKKPEVKEQAHEEEKNSKEVMDLEKASSTRGESYNDDKNKSSFSVTSPTTQVGPRYMRELFLSLCGTYCNIPNIQLSYAT